MASVQSFGFSLFGVKPNLALVGVVAASFFAGGILEIFLLSALAAFILKFAPAPGAELAIFFIVSLLAGLLGRYLPWRRSLNNLAVIFLSVFAFYALAGIKFVVSPFFWKELVLDLAFGWIIFYFLSLCGKMEK